MTDEPQIEVISDNVLRCFPVMPGTEAGLLINGLPVNPLTDPRVDVTDDPVFFGDIDFATAFSVNINTSAEFQCVIDNRTSMELFLGRLIMSTTLP